MIAHLDAFHICTVQINYSLRFADCKQFLFFYFIFFSVRRLLWHHFVSLPKGRNVFFNFDEPFNSSSRYSIRVKTKHFRVLFFLLLLLLRCAFIPSDIYIECGWWFIRSRKHKDIISTQRPPFNSAWNVWVLSEHHIIKIVLMDLFQLKISCPLLAVHTRISHLFNSQIKCKMVLCAHFFHLI